jgi:hypothetical protein
MAETDPFLCATCPGKGNWDVDLDTGASPYATIDAFRQTRRYRLQNPEDYETNEEMAEASARFLRYYDSETDEFYEKEGDVDAAHLGIKCAEHFLAGLCTKSLTQIVVESDIDY